MQNWLEIIVGTVFMGWLTLLTFMISGVGDRVDVASQRIDQMYSKQSDFAADIAATRTAVEYLRDDILEIKEIVLRLDGAGERPAR